MKGLEVTTQSKPPTTKPTYKEYQKFLQTYNDNKSDRSTSPTALSTNSSTSSVSSIISETDNVPVTFNEYLQNYGSKKFSTVKPNLPKKNVKTEIFIQINEDGDKDNLHGRKYNTLRSRKTPGKIILARQNSLNKCDTLKNSILPAGHQVVLSPPPAKQNEVPDEMIYAKTAVLNELCTKPPALHKSPSPILKASVEITGTTDAPSLPPPPPPPPKLPDLTNKAPRMSTTVRKVVPTSVPSKPSHNRPSFINEMQSKFNENTQSRLTATSSGSIQNSAFTGKKSPPLTNPIPIPLPPKLPVLNQHSTSVDVVDEVVTNNANHVRKLSPSNSKDNGLLLIGRKSPPLTIPSVPPPPKFLSQGTKSSEPEANTMTYVPVTDNNTNIDKNNPNVKKLVYNTYRGMLGAYNNKANNMVTMPKHTVIQDQGITKQLESMELQGCLDKLNGRVNPSGENE